MAYRRKTTSRRKTPVRRRRTYARRRVYRRAPTRKRATRRRKTMPISKFTLAQLDPFSEKVAGVKIPDVNTQPSSTVVVEDDHTLSTDGVFGLSAAMFRPCLTATRVNGTAASASSWTWTAGFGGKSDSSKLSTVVSNNTAIRVAAHGVRITCALAPTSVTGFVHIAIVTESEFGNSTWSTPTSIAQMQTSQWYKRIPMAVLTQKPFKVVNKILDHNGFRYFAPSSDLAENATDLMLHTSGWANIMVAVSGSSSLGLPVLSVESIIHLETLPSPGSAQTVSPAANASSAAVEQATNVANATPAVHEEGIFSDLFVSAGNALSGYGNRLYDASVEGARAAGFNAVAGLGGVAYQWLQGTNARMIQY